MGYRLFKVQGNLWFMINGSRLAGALKTTFNRDSLTVNQKWVQGSWFMANEG